MGLGAQTALMDEAWWLPRFSADDGPAASRRSTRPGSARTIYVDAAGRRFVNESNSYMEVGKAMYANKRAVPCWPALRRSVPVKFD